MPSTLQDVGRILRRYPARTVLHPTRGPTTLPTGSRDRTARRFHPGLFVHSHGSRRSPDFLNHPDQHTRPRWEAQL